MTTLKSVKKLLPQSLMVLSAVVSSSGSATPVQALEIFFGQDAGLGKDTRLIDLPHADAARDRFLSRLIDIKTEDFEDYRAGCYQGLNVILPKTEIIIMDGNGCIRNFPTGTNGAGRYPISGNRYWDTFSDFSIIFPQPVAALGFYATDIGDFKGQFTLTFENDTSSTTFFIDTALNCPDRSINCLDGSVLYYGAIAREPSEFFTEVIFGNLGQSGDFFGFDDLSIGNVKQFQPNDSPKSIPEPTSTAATLAFGILGAGLHLLLKRK